MRYAIRLPQLILAGALLMIQPVFMRLTSHMLHEEHIFGRARLSREFLEQFSSFAKRFPQLVLVPFDLLQPDLFTQLHLKFVCHLRHVLEIITLLALRRQVPALFALIDLLGALTPLFSSLYDPLPLLLLSRFLFTSTSFPLGFTSLAIFSFEEGVSCPLVLKLF